MLWNLISKNPFASLKQHMEKTQLCVLKVKEIFEALFDGNKDRVKQLAKEISVLEHDCDRIKQDLRMRVAKSIIMPIERRDLLQVLANMDSVADSAEDVGVLLTMRWMIMPDALQKNFGSFLNKTIEVVDESAQVVFSLDRLLEAGFSGPDGEEVLNRISHIDRLEHEADKAQDQLGKRLFELENELSPAALIMWIKIIERVGKLSDSCERMMSHIRLMIETK
ncbi:MAG: TIGR00153 family protein [Myxococcales bacterium]|nr:TIGR00153 family protein [Myxococcales bacterium]USN50626.1 MAG: TIGR00153 family protein [Myxococcales bacterium]